MHESLFLMNWHELHPDFIRDFIRVGLHLGHELHPGWKTYETLDCNVEAQRLRAAARQSGVDALVLMDRWSRSSGAPNIHVWRTPYKKKEHRIIPKPSLKASTRVFVVKRYKLLILDQVSQVFPCRWSKSWSCATHWKETAKIRRDPHFFSDPSEKRCGKRWRSRTLHHVFDVACHDMHTLPARLRWPCNTPLVRDILRRAIILTPIRACGKGY